MPYSFFYHIMQILPLFKHDYVWLFSSVGHKRGNSEESSLFIYCENTQWSRMQISKTDKMMQLWNLHWMHYVPVAQW